MFPYRISLASYQKCRCYSNCKIWLFFSRELCNPISYCLSVGWSVGPSVGHTFNFLAFCEQFLHHCSCPITYNCCCYVYGIPHCPCPPDYCSCPIPMTYAVVYTALFHSGYQPFRCVGLGMGLGLGLGIGLGLGRGLGLGIGCFL